MRVWAILWSGTLLACAGSYPPRDGGGATDALSAFAGDVAAAAVRAQQAGSRNCGTALAPVRVETAAETRAAVLSEVARRYGVPISKVNEEATPCGSPATALCASRFQNHVYHGDGRMGDELYPLAQRVERDAPPVQLSIWTPSRDGVVFSTAVTIAGSYRGWLLGLGWFQGSDWCGGG